MASYTVASVPYLNAKPLVRFFEELPGALPVRVVYDVPSKLPAMLESGAVEAALVSSIDALTVPGRRFAEGLGIISEGPVQSVRLFSRVAPDKIQRLALDRSSMTSNALAQIVLAERYGVRPEAKTEPPALEKMLELHDAAVLIGDIGLRQADEGLNVLDLGEEWTGLTGLPFVWALWIGAEGLTPELVGHLRRARAESCLGAFRSNSGQLLSRFAKVEREFDDLVRARQAATIAAIAKEEGWPVEQVRRYLTKTISFDLGERELGALRTFRGLIEKHGLAKVAPFPLGVASNRDFAAAI